MSIFRRGKTWYASYSLPGGKRIKESLGTEDKRLAQELHDSRKAERWRVDRLGEMPDYTFEEACLRWIEEKSHKKSLNDDKSRMVFWLEHFEGVKLKDITEVKVYSIVSKMTNRRHRIDWEKKSAILAGTGAPPPAYVPKSVTPATKATHLALLKSILRAAERDWKWLHKAPSIKVPQAKHRRIRWLEPHEAQRLISECREPLKSIVKFALSTGLRRANIVNLEWPQIDMQRRMAWVDPEESKSGRAIGVALNDTACKTLRDQIGQHNRWVFVYPERVSKKGRVTAVRKMRIDANEAWHGALKRAGIENFRFHDLRHTWASWLVQAGTPISVLQEMGGWESIEMVRRYAHLSPNHLTHHAKQIDSILEVDVPNLSHNQNNTANK